MFRGTYVNTYATTEEIQKAIKSIKGYQAKALIKIDEAINKSTKVIGRDARRNVAVKSGRLKKRIRTRFVKKETLGLVSARTPYAHILEGGAKAVVIKSKKGKAMQIKGANTIQLNDGSVASSFAFIKKVSIPKRKARPFMKPAYEKEVPNLLKNIKEAVKP